MSNVPDEDYEPENLHLDNNKSLLNLDMIGNLVVLELMFLS